MRQGPQPVYHNVLQWGRGLARTGGEKRVNYISVSGDAHSTPPACGAANTPALALFSCQAQMQMGSDTVAEAALVLSSTPPRPAVQRERLGLGRGPCSRQGL